MHSIDLTWLDSLPAEAQVALRTELEADLQRNKLFTYYPDVGPLRRELYARHLIFFELGRRFSTRAFMAANRIGKTEGAGGYECTLHLTGRYPAWWKGARFDAPVRCWLAGDTGKSVREIIQQKMLGDWGKFGTGLIPASDLVRWTSKQGVGEAIDTLWVKHYDTNGKHDGDSRVVFKSYDQGRISFQGTEQDIIWLDEEAPDDIRGECAIRLMTTDGLLIETFTPLKGITTVVRQYLPKGEVGSDVKEQGWCQIGKDKAMVMAGWSHVPHLGEAEKERMLAECAPHLRDARSKGIPSLGAGAIYPVPEDDFKVKDFPLPAHWKRAYALDVGWNRTAALWGAIDPENDCVYIYSEHYKGQAEPIIHAASIKTRGDWIPGVIDPAARGRGQDGGTALLQQYKDLGLKLTKAENSVEAGLLEVWQRLSTGRITVFASCSNFFVEYRMYRRDENGKIVKEHDHAMDCLRYFIASALKIAMAGVDVRRGQAVIPGIGMLDLTAGY